MDGQVSKSDGPDSVGVLLLWPSALIRLEFWVVICVFKVLSICYTWSACFPSNWLWQCRGPNIICRSSYCKCLNTHLSLFKSCSLFLLLQLLPHKFESSSYSTLAFVRTSYNPFKTVEGHKTCISPSWSPTYIASVDKYWMNEENHVLRFSKKISSL